MGDWSKTRTAVFPAASTVQKRQRRRAKICVHGLPWRAVDLETSKLPITSVGLSQANRQYRPKTLAVEGAEHIIHKSYLLVTSLIHREDLRPGFSRYAVFFAYGLTCDLGYKYTNYHLRKWCCVMGSFPPFEIPRSRRELRMKVGFAHRLCP